MRRNSRTLPMRQARLLKLSRLLVSRLERISADSIWAHRASGHRGMLLRSIDRLENVTGLSAQELEYIERLIKEGFRILEKAGIEVPVPEDMGVA